MTSAPIAGYTTQLSIALRAYANAQGPFQSIVASWDSPDALTCNGQGSYPVPIPPNAVGYELDLASMFPAFTEPLFVALQDASQPGTGFSWYSDADSTNKQTVAPNGFHAWTPNGQQALSSLYIDNPSAINTLLLQVAVASN
jgi:hypothetical protein